MLKEIIKIANELDEMGLMDQADELDSVVSMEPISIGQEEDGSLSKDDLRKAQERVFSIEEKVLILIQPILDLMDSLEEVGTHEAAMLLDSIDRDNLDEKLFHNLKQAIDHLIRDSYS